MNDASSKTSNEILDQILDLKKHVENVVPGINVVVSKMIIRAGNPKANTILGNVNKKLLKLGIKLLDHSNISLNDLGRKGLHLNEIGIKKLALNIISFIRKMRLNSKFNHKIIPLRPSNSANMSPEINMFPSNFSTLELMMDLQEVMTRSNL